MKDNMRIDDILNECLERLLAGNGTIEQCLQSYPQHAAELEPLLRTALAMDRAVRIEPGAEAKARVRYQLQLQMAEADKPRRSLRWNWQPRWAMAAMAVLLVFVLAGGSVVAADSSMPGSPLYPVKIATENVRLSLASNETEEAELLTAFADRRVDEIDYVMASGKANAKDVDKLAQRYIKNINGIASLHVVTGNGVAALIQPTVSTASTPADTFALTAPAPETGTPAPEAGKRDGEPSQQAGIAAEPARESEDEREDKKKEESKIERLKEIVNYYGSAHPQQLEKLLEDDRVPEKYKPAIRRMVQEAKQNSQEALRNLERRESQDRDKDDD